MPSEANGLMTLRFWISPYVHDLSGAGNPHTHTHTHNSTHSSTQVLNPQGEATAKVF